MLSEFDPAENETSCIKAWQTKYKPKKEIGKKMYQNKVCMNMYYVPKQYQKLTYISNFTKTSYIFIKRFEVIA